MGPLLTVLVSVLFLLAGCSSGATADLPSTTTAAAFTHAQVLGWVTPTLENGISFVGSARAAATDAQLVAATRPLATAASVSLHELTEVSWKGRPHADEQVLVNALLRVESLTSAPPGPGYLARVDAAIRSTRAALRSLSRGVRG